MMFIEGRAANQFDSGVETNSKTLIASKPPNEQDSALRDIRIRGFQICERP